MSSGVWLDPEDDGIGHTATQCPITNDLNLPTVTVANWYSSSAYILNFCVIFETEVNVLLYSYCLTELCCYTATD